MKIHTYIVTDARYVRVRHTCLQFVWRETGVPQILCDMANLSITTLEEQKCHNFIIDICEDGKFPNV